jgi:flagellar M-ring protein FliF
MIEQLTALARSLTISQRIGIVFGAAMSVLLVVGLVMWAGQPQLVPGFTGLDAATAGEVTAALDSAGIPYELKAAGGIVMVPSNQLAEARIAAADAGYTGSTAPGWEIFDNPTFGQTQDQQQIAEQRAIQGDLQADIQSIEGVEEASVTIVPQEEGTLTSQDNLASASVWVRMRGGNQPSNEIVNGIVALTASSVKGLVPENVTVVDSNGTTLAGPGDAQSEAVTIQNATERAMEAKILQILYPVVGADNARVAVTAALDLDKVAKTVTEYAIGDQNTPTSAQQTTELVGGEGTGNASGIPGTQSNVAGITYPNASPEASLEPGASPASYLKTSATVNWANTQIVSDIIQTPGSVKGISVAVMLNQAAVDAAGLTSETITSQITPAIAAAIGAVNYNGLADPEAVRMDPVQVVPVKFVEAPPVAAPFAMPPVVTDIVPTILGVVLGSILLFLVWRNMRSLRTRAEDMQLLASRGAYPQLGSGDMAVAGMQGGYHMAGIPELAAPPTPQSRAQEHIRMLADEKPDDLASLVQTWLREDEKKRR